MNIQKVDMCLDCGEMAENCLCEDVQETNECCPRCSILLDVIDEILMAENTQEALEILRDFVDIVEDVAYREGCKDTLRNQAEAMLDLADELECENCDGCCEE